jgi:antitoxin YefM
MFSCNAFFILTDNKIPNSIGNCTKSTYICTIRRTKNLYMLTTSISDFRKDIKKYLDRVTENFETLIINRGKDSGVVIMSLEEYNSLSATQHELSSFSNEKRLDTAISKLQKGFTFQKDLIET